MKKHLSKTGKFMALLLSLTVLISIASGAGISFAERVKGTAPDYNEVTKESFENANGGTTYYIKFYDPSVYPNYINLANSWVAHTKNTYVTNADFESSDNTISMWLDATACGYVQSEPHGIWKDILCYRIDYNDGGNNTVTLDLGINPDGTWNAVSAPRAYDGVNVIREHTDGAFEVPKGFKHVVITNPKAADGKKTMDVYVNGVFQKSVELDVSGTVSHATMHFFGNSSIGDEYWKSRNDIIPEAKLGGLRVYEGVMSAEDIADLYTAQRPEFSDANAKEITGYTFDGATIEYDGASHNIEVTKAPGATEGVEIAYTCNGEAFTGAKEPGTYYITATITKESHLPLVLSASLKIRKAAVQHAYGDLLIDLDFSTYVKDDSSTDPNTVDGSVGEVTNNGLLSDSTVLKFKSEHGRWCTYDLALEEMENALGATTYYLHKTVVIDYCTDANRFSTIIEEGLEDEANTISFWANYVPCNRTGLQWNILDYSAQYGDTSGVLFSLYQAGTTSNEFILTGRGEIPNYGNITDIAAGKWAQYIITNPEYAFNSETGKFEKTMSVYVNGVLRGSKTVTKPDGSLSGAKLAFGGEAVNPGASSGKNWPTDMAFGGIKVYSGVLTDTDIKEKYDGELSLYEAVSEFKIIEFVNGEDETIESLGNLTSVTLKYTPDSDDTVLYFVACCDENGNMLTVKCAKDEKDGTLAVDLPDGTKTVKGFAWKLDSLNPLAKEIVLAAE